MPTGDSVENAVLRVRCMEMIFDVLCSEADADPSAVDRYLFSILTDYYENGWWMHDYELDEKGYLPKDLKRGVLSEDGVYDLIIRIESCPNDV